MTRTTNPTEHRGALATAMRSLRRALGYCFVFSFGLNFLSLMLPIYSLQVYDRVFTTRSMDTLLGLTAVVLVAYIFYGMLHAVRSGVIAKIVAWLETELSFTVLETSLHAAAAQVPISAGQQLRELGTLKNFIASAAPTLMDVPWSVLFLFVIYMINPLLGLLALCGMGMFIVVAVLNEYATRKALLRASEKSTESLLSADMIGRQAESIQAMGMMPGVIASWRRDFDRSLKWQDLAQQRSAMLQGFARSMRMVLQIAITGFGAYLVLHNEMTGGGLIAASILIARAVAPFEGMIMLWKQLVQARDAYQRLETLFREAPTPVGDTAMPVPRGILTVEGLYYAPPKKPAILKNVSFRLEAGEMLGIIGPSAAGKTTLSKMLMGIIAPSSGHVRLDGADVHGWAREDFGKYAGYLPQSVELFPGTIKQNIARMQQKPEDAGVVEAAQRAYVHELILQLPGGYDTTYIPGVSVLSPGQKQRIGLARALYGMPKYIVLDEPNSNLDGDGERALMATLSWLKQQRVTTIIVAHRPSILTMVDKIMMLRGGVVEAVGPRDEMMQRYSGNARKPDAREVPHGG